jgi:hypothetical protein
MAEVLEIEAEGLTASHFSCWLVKAVRPHGKIPDAFSRRTFLDHRQRLVVIAWL